MHTEQTRHGDAFELKKLNHQGPVAEGKLSSGLAYEIVFSRGSAVDEGVHLILSFPGLSRELEPVEEGESLVTLLSYARSLKQGTSEDFRVGLNFGELRKNKSWHAHLILPGSDAEIEAAPRFVEKWINKD